MTKQDPVAQDARLGDGKVDHPKSEDRERNGALRNEAARQGGAGWCVT
ncbi:MAG: hypothetical protein ACHQAQ_01720 [Hyphomicrobiales bacterium]